MIPPGTEGHRCDVTSPSSPDIPSILLPAAEDSGNREQEAWFLNRAYKEQGREREKEVEKRRGSGAKGGEREKEGERERGRGEGERERGGEGWERQPHKQTDRWTERESEV